MAWEEEAELAGQSAIAGIAVAGQARAGTELLWEEDASV